MNIKFHVLFHTDIGIMITVSVQLKLLFFCSRRDSSRGIPDRDGQVGYTQITASVKKPNKQTPKQKEHSVHAA